MNIDDTLWCLHVSGPDDVIPEPTHDAAVRFAQKFNRWANQKAAEWNENDPPLDLMRAKVIPWPYSAEDHAKRLSLGDERYG